MTFAISYGLSFASITATLTHSFLYFRKQIVAQSRRSMREQPDIHARLMAKYPQVPEWWYGIIFCAFGSCNGSMDNVRLTCFVDSFDVCVWCHLDRGVAY